MSRPRILPLPDSQARAIIGAVDALATALPAGHSTRQFLAPFIAQVYDITGRVYGHGTYRDLLGLYARDHGYRPSAVTIALEIKAFRAQLDKRLATAPVLPAPARDIDAWTPPAQGREAPSGSRMDGGAALELNRLQLLEITRLREALNTATARLELAEQQRQAAADEATQANARLTALQSSYELETQRYAELLAEVGRGQAQADASHRYALNQVESVRAETRAAQAETEQVRRKITALEQQLANERAISDSLRRQRNEQLAAQRGQR
jgi:hypothetical protein